MLITDLLKALAVLNKCLPNTKELVEILTSSGISDAVVRLLLVKSTKPKYAMAMTAFNRPGYMREVLYTLANNSGLEDYTLHFGLEPVNQEVIATAKSAQFMPTVVVVNSHSLGVTENPYTMLKRVFETTDVPGVLYLEEDVILAPDAVRLATWYFEHPERNNYLCLNLYNPDSQADADPTSLIASDKFNALAAGITREQWEKHFKDGWHKNPAGWDWSLIDIAKAVFVLTPAISRSHHIGREGGTYYDASRHDAIYCPNPMCTQPASEFRIVN